MQVALINEIDPLRRRVIAKCHEHQAYVRRNTVSERHAGATAGGDICRQACHAHCCAVSCVCSVCMCGASAACPLHNALALQKQCSQCSCHGSCAACRHWCGASLTGASSSKSQHHSLPQRTGTTAETHTEATAAAAATHMGSTNIYALPGSAANMHACMQVSTAI